MNIKFPLNFLWGSSTSSHQIEGNCFNNWSEWEKSSKRIDSLNKNGLIEKYGLDNFISGESIDNYNKFKEDILLLKKFNQKIFRFTVEWSKVEPEEGKIDYSVINHYKEEINFLVENNIEPMVCFWHWTVPVWFDKKGAFLKRKNIKYFEKFVDLISKEIKSKYYITLNEIEVFTANSYLTGVRPPQNKNIFKAIIVLFNLLLAHKKSYRIIKQNQKDSLISIAKSNTYFSSNNNLVCRLIKNIIKYILNDFMLYYLKDELDFIGLNYYIHYNVCPFKKEKNIIKNDLGWELCPESVYYLLKDLKKYNKDIIITENGLADKDDKYRIWYIYETIKNMKKAIDENIRLTGYMHWSFFDNFEWDQGRWPRFGLVNIDYNNNLERIPRKSAYFLKDVIENNGINEEIEEKYKNEINLE